MKVMETLAKSKTSQPRSIRAKWIPPHTADDFVALFNGYCEKVSQDTDHKKYCRLTCLAVTRHIKDHKKLEDTHHFDIRHGIKVCLFLEKLKHLEGSWEAQTLRLMDWQVFIICCIFGWYEKDTNLRRFNDVYIEVPRKNGKSALTAGIALYMLCFAEESSPLILCAATTGDQALKVFKPARHMAATNPALQKKFQLEILETRIRNKENNGLIQTVNSKSASQEGHNPSFVSFDELHAHPSSALYDVLRMGEGMRDNPLFWTITTAGMDTDGVCFQERETAISILEGSYKIESRFGMIFTLDQSEKPDDPSDNIFDPTVWPKANPVLHAQNQLVSSRMIRTLKNFADSASVNETLQAEFMRKRLNIWVDEDIKYFNTRDFASEPNLIKEWPDPEYFYDLPCSMGLDLAARKDLTALCIMWIDKENVLWAQWDFWLPRKAFKKYALDKRQPWVYWRDKGFLNVLPGETTDYRIIYKRIEELEKVYNVRDIAFDSHDANQLVHDLSNAGFNTIEFMQSTGNYNAPMKSWVKRIADGTLKHPLNEVMNWNISNVIARNDVNMNEAPDRKNSKGKIDGVCAGLMATAVLETEENISIEELDRHVLIL